MEPATTQPTAPLRRADKLLTTAALGFLLSLGLLLLGGWLLRIALGQTETRDVARYEACLAIVRDDLATAASRHMPGRVPGGTGAPSMYFRDDAGDRGLTLVLRCILPAEEIERLTTAWGPVRLPVRRLRTHTSDGEFEILHYTRPDFSRIEPTADRVTGLPPDFEVFLLHEAGPSAGTDTTSGGFAVRRSDGTVLYWVHRHWASYN